MSNLSVAVIDPFHSLTLRVIAEALPSGWTMILPPRYDEDGYAEALHAAEILFVMATPLPAKRLQAATRLKFIQKLGAGLDGIDLTYCQSRGVGVARLQAGNSIQVAEHTLLLMLACYRDLPRLNLETHRGAWIREEARAINRQIDGKTIGLIGFGAIGRAVAKLLAGFNVSILYADPIPAPPDVETNLRAQRVGLEDVLGESDIVSLHLPLTDETRGYINADRLASMKRNAVLINCARGGIVDEAALQRMIIEGHISFAAIDTFAREPPVGSPLLGLDRAILTPHTAGGTIDNFTPVVKRAVDNARRFLAGEALSPKELIIAPVRGAACT
jgi:D-3-phosphoglycerate dehydrogenase